MDDDLRSEQSNDSTMAIGSSQQSPVQGMDLSSVVDVHIDNVDMNEDEADQDDLETAAVNEQLNQIEAELAPIIKTLVQMKTSFDQMEDQKDVIDKNTQLLCWESDLLLQEIKRD